jgi:hypothetical protein
MPNLDIKVSAFGAGLSLFLRYSPTRKAVRAQLGYKPKKESAGMARAFKINASGARIVMARIARGLIMPFAFAAMTLTVGHTFAQGAFPAPLPGQAAAPVRNALRDACMKEFAHLREEAVERAKLIEAARERHAPPDEACNLLGNFARSEIKMIKYIEANSAKCEIPQQIADQLKAGHKNTEAMQTKVCVMARQAQTRDPSLSEVLGPPKKEPAGPVGDFGMFR